MNKQQLTRLIAGLMLTMGFFFAQATPPVETGPDNKLVLKNTTFTQDAVSINYEIPFGGMIIFYLFDGEESLIWRTQGTQRRGENSILLKTAKLDQGKRYNFRLEYKGNAYTGQFEGR